MVTVMPDVTLAALPVVGAAESGRADGGAGTEDLLGVIGGLGDGSVGEAEAEAVGTLRVLDDDAGDETAAPVGRNFLLDRSTEPEDCQDRLCESVAPDARSGLAGEAYF